MADTMAPPSSYQPDPNLKKMRDQFFQSRRAEAVQGANAQTQAGDDAIQRRFASMGASGSGAQIAALQKNREAGLEATRKAESDIGGQELQAGEADFGRSFAASQADKDMAFKQRLADTEQSNKLKEIDLAQQQFALDKDTTEFNKRMAEIEAGQTPSKSFIKDIADIPGQVIGAVKENPGGAAAGSTLGGIAMGPVGNVVGAITGGGK